MQSSISWCCPVRPYVLMCQRTRHYTWECKVGQTILADRQILHVRTLYYSRLRVLLHTYTLRSRWCQWHGGRLLRRYVPRSCCVYHIAYIRRLQFMLSHRRVCEQKVPVWATWINHLHKIRLYYVWVCMCNHRTLLLIAVTLNGSCTHAVNVQRNRWPFLCMLCKANKI